LHYPRGKQICENLVRGHTGGIQGDASNFILTKVNSGVVVFSMRSG